MKISFVIPAYNEEKGIGECLKHIFAELRRGKYDYEIIVVNNASTDKTADVARSYAGVQVVDETRKGIVWARLAGYKASTGDLIANIDADSLLPEGWLRKVWDEFENDSELLALSGPLVYYDLPLFDRVATKIWYIVGYVGDFIGSIFTGRSSMLQGGNYVVRRSTMEKIGGFDTNIEFYGEDTDTGRRIGEVGKKKWMFSLYVNSSGRRVKGEGLVTMGLKYAINYFSTTFFGKPYTKEYKDFRN